ncbi:MAG TPA: hypothetical protein VF363_02055 [Candidatus Eisenbacteria bacterium]
MRRHRVPAPALLAVLSALLVSGCGRPFAEGGSRELTVITTWPAGSPELLLLRAIVEREAIRIEREPAYLVTIASPRDGRAYRARNVLLCGSGPLDRVPNPCRRLSALLGGSRDPFAFTTDLWLRGQCAGIVWTEDRADWISSVAAAQNRLFHALDRATYATVRSRLLALPRDAEAERRLARSLGIRLSIPRGYELRIDPAAKAALLIDEGPPARLLRLSAAPPDTTTDLRRARESLARLFRPDERTLDVEDPELVPAEMSGELRQWNGRWEDDAATAAGPFRAYEVTRRGHRYLVDLAVFAPGRPKLPYLRELTAIAETLEPAP